MPKLKRVKPGDPITAAMWNALCDTIESQALTVAAPLTMRVSPLGTMLSTLPGTELQLAKTKGSGIAARSGTTLGSATVDLWSIGTGDTIVDVGRTETAKNFSGTAIASSKYVIIAEWLDKWIVISVEC